MQHSVSRINEILPDLDELEVFPTALKTCPHCTKHEAEIALSWRKPLYNRSNYEVFFTSPI